MQGIGPMSMTRAVPGALRASSRLSSGPVAIGLDMAAAIGLAVVACATVRWLPTAIWPLTALLFLLGAPHGGVMLRGGAARLPSASFILCYLAAAAAVTGLFMASPLCGLALFFLLSAWHFSRAEGSSGLGLFVTFAAFLLAPEQTHALIAELAGQSSATDMVMLAGKGGAVLGAILCAATAAKGRHRDGVPRIVLVGLLFALLPPLLAMGIYFFALHSLAEYRAHMLTRREAGLSLFLPVGVPVLAGGAILYAATMMGLVPVSLLASLAFALAIPHMLDEALGHKF